MTKDRVRANGPAMSRRTVFTAVPVSVATLAAPRITQAQAPDPLVPLHREWSKARREWCELAKLPGNEDWDDPRSLAAEQRELAAQKRMLELTPTSPEGIAALAELAWTHIDEGYTDPHAYEEMVKLPEFQAIAAIWRACTGFGGYPVN